MRCQKCLNDFEEKDIQLSHDVPKYIGGTDADGRHWLCKKCHDIYERIAFSVAVKNLSEHQRENIILLLKTFSYNYFPKKNDETTKSITGQ